MKSCVVVVALILLAQVSFADVLVDRGLPTENVNQVTNNGWGAQRSNIQWGEYDVNDSRYDAKYAIMGDDFTLPSTAGSYHVTSISLWVGGYPNTAFGDMFNSISLWMAPGGPSTSATPLSLVSTVYSGTSTTYSNSQGYLKPPSGTYPDPIPSDYYYGLWQVDFPVDITAAGGTQFNFGIQSNNKIRTGSYAYIAFVTGSNEYSGSPMYSGGSPTFIGADDLYSEFDSTGHYMDSFEIGAHYGDANILVNGTAVPEPSSIMLLICGAVGLVAYAWREQK